MNALQIKTFLWKEGLTITQIANDLQPEYGATVHSLRTMLTDLFYHGRPNTKLTDLVKKRYGITVDTKRRTTVKEAVKRAA